jgi:hypothetical protein
LPPIDSDAGRAVFFFPNVNNLLTDLYTCSRKIYKSVASQHFAGLVFPVFESIKSTVSSLKEMTGHLSKVQNQKNLGVQKNNGLSTRAKKKIVI